MGIFDFGLLGMIFKKRPTNVGPPTTTGPNLLETMNGWFSNPHPPLSLIDSILPVRIRSDEAARYHFTPPKFGLPRIINILDKSTLPGVGLLPPMGPRQ